MFDTLRAFAGCAFPSAEAVGRPSLDFHSPPELITGTPHRPAGCPARRTMLTLLSFGDPTTQSRASGSVLGRQQIPLPPRVASGVWIPPSRPPPLALPALCTPERPWVSPFKAFPSHTIGAPLGAHALLALPPPRRPLPGECLPEHGRLQGLAPVASPCCRRIHEGSGRRCLLEVLPSRASTQPTWRAC